MKSRIDLNISIFVNEEINFEVGRPLILKLAVFFGLPIVDEHISKRRAWIFVNKKWVIKQEPAWITKSALVSPAGMLNTNAIAKSLEIQQWTGAWLSLIRFDSIKLLKDDLISFNILFKLV